MGLRLFVVSQSPQDLSKQNHGTYCFFFYGSKLIKTSTKPKFKVVDSFYLCFVMLICIQFFVKIGTISLRMLISHDRCEVISHFPTGHLFLTTKSLLASSVYIVDSLFARLNQLRSQQMNYIGYCRQKQEKCEPFVLFKLYRELYSTMI